MARNKKNFKSLPRKQQIAILLKSKQYNPNTKIRTLKGKELKMSMALPIGFSLAAVSIIGGSLLGSKLGRAIGFSTSKIGRTLLKNQTKGVIFEKVSKSFYKKAVKNKREIDKIIEVVKSRKYLPNKLLTGKVGFRKYSKNKYPDVNVSVSKVKSLFSRGKLAEKKAKIYKTASRKEYTKYTRNYYKGNLDGTYLKTIIPTLFGTYLGTYVGAKLGVSAGEKIIKKSNPEYYKKQELNQKIINLNKTKNTEKRRKQLKELDKLI